MSSNVVGHTLGLVCKLLGDVGEMLETASEF